MKVLELALSESTSKKWQKPIKALGLTYLQDPVAFTQTSLDVMLSILNISTSKYEELATVMHQMYRALKETIPAKDLVQPLFVRHIEAAFKLTRPTKKKTIMPKAFAWLEVLIKEAPPEYFRLALENKLRPENLIRYIFHTCMQLISGIMEDAKDKQLYEDDSIRVRAVSIASHIFERAN
jgi:hypothetical protein